MASETNPTIDLLANRVSVRAFTDDPVSDEMVDAIVEAARRSPTSSNWQTYSVIIVRDPDIKSRLYELSGRQGHVQQSQVFLAFAADIRRLDQAGALHDQTPAGGLNQTLVSIVDASLVGQTAQTAAESFGLGAVMVGAMRRDPRAVAETLGLPEGVFVVFGMSIGWPEGDPRAAGLKPRLPAELVVHRDRYDDSGADHLIRGYDAELKAFYERRGRNLDDAAWSGPVANRSSQRSYTDVAPFLRDQGFSLD
jgi:nitroreductase